MSSTTLHNKKITVMGLGLNGGGLAAAKFCASRGAIVTVTDLRDKETLRPSIEALKDYEIHFVLGEHREEDFINADMVIKNPAVPPSSKYLQLASNVASDMTLFLEHFKGPIIAVTGTKGKSSTASAIYHGLKHFFPHAQLGGNITISPLSFLDDLEDNTPVVLELSSWQLADITDIQLLKPKVSIITNIMHDHQNRYETFQDYVDDKRLIYQSQDPKSTYRLFFADDDYGPKFKKEVPENSYYFSYSKNAIQNQGVWCSDNSAYFRFQNKDYIAANKDHQLKGLHMKLNLGIAGMALALFGIQPDKIEEALRDFKGVAHRMELVASTNKLAFYNDSAATIPDALVATAKSFEEPSELIIGGTDKELDFSILEKLKNWPVTLHILEGTAFEKIHEQVLQHKLSFTGPHPSLESAFKKATENALSKEQTSIVPIILSPGCASFGMFKNEFHRGNSFRTLAENFTGA